MRRGLMAWDENELPRGVLTQRIEGFVQVQSPSPRLANWFVSANEQTYQIAISLPETEPPSHLHQCVSSS